MLAGILIVALLFGGLLFAIPWMSEQRVLSELELEAEEPADRFSQSMRILQQDVMDLGDPSAVSTPLTRAAERYGLAATARHAAKRRSIVLVTLLCSSAVLGVGAVLGWVPNWSPLLTLGLVAVFVGIARFTVVSMHRRFDSYAASLDRGFCEDEDTVVIELVEEESFSAEFSVDLEAPVAKGSFWESVPVTAPTYVQKPLLPRTVRTIDLSSPVADSALTVPTADHPDAIVEEESAPMPRVVGQ